MRAAVPDVPKVLLIFSSRLKRPVQPASKTAYQYQTVAS